MEPYYSLPLPPNWVANSASTSRAPILPTWDELEPLASFTNEAVSHEDTHQSLTFRDRLRSEKGVATQKVSQTSKQSPQTKVWTQ